MKILQIDIAGGHDISVYFVNDSKRNFDHLASS